MIERLYDYENQLKKAVDSAVNNINKGDVCGYMSYSQSVSFEQDKLSLIDDVSYTNISCRIFHKGKVGNASVNCPDDIEDMIANAQDSSVFGEEIDIELPRMSKYAAIPWLYSEGNLKYGKQELKDIAEELLIQIKKIAPEAKISTGIQNDCSLNVLGNTEGFRGEYLSSGVSLYGGLFEIAPDGSFLEMYESEAFYDTDYCFDHILNKLRYKLEKSRHTSELTKTGKMPVIFAPSSIDILLSPIEIAANGTTLYKNLSLFANKKDEEIFDSKFTFIDDPFYYKGSSSMPFDDEGTIPCVMNIIENGVFKHFIYDCMTAKRMGVKTTGHASRGSNFLPVPSFSNRIIKQGHSSLEEMISSVDFGILLCSSLGEGQYNSIAGDFSVLVETGYLIENGVLKGKVKDVMISGNVFDLLKNISMIENTIHQEGALFTPHIMVDGVTLSKH